MSNREVAVRLAEMEGREPVTVERISQIVCRERRMERRAFFWSQKQCGGDERVDVAVMTAKGLKVVRIDREMLTLPEKELDAEIRRLAARLFGCA
jgi:hypothetical protein